MDYLIEPSKQDKLKNALLGDKNLLQTFKTDPKSVLTKFGVNITDKQAQSVKNCFSDLISNSANIEQAVSKMTTISMPTLQRY